MYCWGTFVGGGGDILDSNLINFCGLTGRTLPRAPFYKRQKRKIGDFSDFEFSWYEKYHWSLIFVLLFSAHNTYKCH